MKPSRPFLHTAPLWRLLVHSVALLPAASPCATAQQEDPRVWKAEVVRTGFDEGVFQFPARPGYLYLLEAAHAGVGAETGDWAPTPEAVHCPATAVSSPLTLQLPVRLPALPVPAGTVPAAPPLPVFSFTVYACSNGSATVTFNSSEGGAARVFLPAFDLYDDSPSDGEDDELLTGAATLPYPEINPLSRLLVLVFDAGAAPRPGWEGRPESSLTAADAGVLARLTSSRARLFAALDAPPPPPVSMPPTQPRVDEYGLPRRLFHRVVELALDSDHDGVTDAAELANEAAGSAYTGNATNPARYDTGYGGIWDGFTGLILSEIMSANDGGTAIPLGNGQFYEGDWLELYNPTRDNVYVSTEPSTSLDPTGVSADYYLSLCGDLPCRWQLPPMVVPPGGRVLILCPGSDATGATSLPKTDFQLEGGNSETAPASLFLTRQPAPPPGGGPAGPLELVDALVPGSEPVTAFGYTWPGTPNYTRQCENYSFVRYCRDTETVLRWGVCPLPTPGAENRMGYEGIAPEPVAIGTARRLVTDGNPISQLLGAAPGDVIYYTLNGTWPTSASEHFVVPPAESGLPQALDLTLTNTTVIRAFTHRPGWWRSLPVTHTIVFPQSVLGTADASLPAQQKPSGWPEDNTISAPASGTPAPRFKMKFGFDQATADAHRAVCAAGLSALPIVSITGTVGDLFDKNTGGLYAHSDSLYRNSDTVPGNNVPDPRGLDWQRPVSFEFIPPSGGGPSAHKLADLSLSGTGSLIPSVNAKYGFRVNFRKDCRSGKLDYSPGSRRLFPGAAPQGSARKEFGDLILRALSQDSYAGYTFSAGTFGTPEATSLREDFGMAVMCQAGTVSGQPCTPGNPSNDLGKGVHHRRRVHLFLNGLYWGVYALCERVDEDFMENYFTGNAGDWEVWGNDDIFNSTTQPEQWRTLLRACRNVARFEHALPAEEGSNPAHTTAADTYAWISARMDLAGYLDYLLTNVYLGNFDWPANNFRFAWRSPAAAAGERFVFLPWDMEYSLIWSGSNSQYRYLSSAALATQTSEVIARSRLFLGGAAEPFLALREHAPFRTLIESRLAAHFDSAGASFHRPAAADPLLLSLWDAQKTAFSPVYELESGRWSLTGTWFDTGSNKDTSYYGKVFDPNDNNSSYKITAFQRDEPGFRSSNPQLGDWNRSTNWIRNNWFTAAREDDTKNALRSSPPDAPAPPPGTLYVPPPSIGSFQNKAYLYYSGGEMFYTGDGSDPMTSPTAKVYTRENNNRTAFVPIDIEGTQTFKARTRLLGFLWSEMTSATYTYTAP